jgi:hypothetical protein
MFGILGFVTGIFLLVAGFFMVFFFPGVADHQGEGFSYTGIIVGVLMLVFGVVLAFF